MIECRHFWISNSGRGGEPIFKVSRQISTEPIMHVHCHQCNARTWFNKTQWNMITEGIE